MSPLCGGGYLPILLTDKLGAHTVKNFSSLWMTCVVRFMAHAGLIPKLCRALWRDF